MGEDVRPSGGRSRLRRIVGWTAVALAVVLVAAGVTVTWAYRSLDGNLESDATVFAGIVGERPSMPRFADGKPLNILVMGTDSREGQTLVKDTTPGLSDTTLLVHISRDRSRSYVVSVPRDLMVDRPRCVAKDDPDRVLPATGPVMWNAAYAVGGPACTIAQFEQMTNIRVDHFVIVRFESVMRLADALDGVPVCVEETIDDPANSIHLPGGCYDAKGFEALSYVRVRFKIGDGSDIGRLERQQVFMASMLDKATSLGTLSNPMRLYHFLEEVTKSFVTDPGLASIGKLTNLGLQLQDVPGDRIEMFSMPFTSYAPDPNRLAPASDAALLWEQLRNDEELDDRFTDDAVSPRRDG